MTNSIQSLIFTAMLSLIASAEEAPPSLATCFGCHGPAGISGNQLWPNLAGQKKEYLIKQMKAFRSEERKDSMMNPMVKPLRDEEIEKLAQYFSELK